MHHLPAFRQILGAIVYAAYLVPWIVGKLFFNGIGWISSTPTYILAGIRFTACDFKASELPSALELAKKARKGDEDAKERIIKIITNGLMNETML